MIVIVHYSLTFLLFFSPLLSGFSLDQCVYLYYHLKMQKENGTLSRPCKLSGGGLLCGMVRWWVGHLKEGTMG